MEARNIVYLVPFLLVVTALYLYRTRRRRANTSISGQYGKLLEKPAPLSQKSQLTANPNFDIYNAEPAKFRPFKPRFFMSMGIERCSPNDLFLLDNQYVDRIVIRREIMEQHSSIVLGAEQGMLPAIIELYEYIISVHLPTLLPQYFIADKARGVFINKILNVEHPLSPPITNNGVDALRILATTVEDDLLLLYKDGNGEYRLGAFATLFPAGFDTSRKCGLTLRGIHGPVPLYKEKLAMSMDRFFSKLEVGKIVRRFNWQIVTTDMLFTPSGNHFYEGDVLPDSEKKIDMNNVFLRSERQTLHRLAKSKAILFTIKTYVYPIAEIKQEGLGEQLATAIEGLPDNMANYKRRMVWGEAVLGYLRS